MNARAAAALFCMGQSITRPMAQHWARLAKERGATDDELNEAWNAWDTAQAEQVHVIEVAE